MRKGDVFDFSTADLVEASESNPELKNDLQDLSKFYFLRVRKALFFVAKPDHGTWVKIPTEDDFEIYLADQVFAGISSLGKLMYNHNNLAKQEAENPDKIRCNELELVIKWLLSPKINSKVSQKRRHLFIDLGKKLLLLRNKYSQEILAIAAQKKNTSSDQPAL